MSDLPMDAYSDVETKQSEEMASKRSALPLSGGFYGKRSSSLDWRDDMLMPKRGFVSNDSTNEYPLDKKIRIVSGGIYGKRTMIPLSGGLYGKRSRAAFIDTNRRRLSLRSIPMSGGFFG
ncbi:unnamed protein product [Anisakis simplex]|uniref:Ovule protein n=1 Tax=Anisakis simplex TaxID=6269 RepID=A0A0M3K1Z6_ANISI|nr:unnamed protein product [Anisakis simplex]